MTESQQNVSPDISAPHPNRLIRLAMILVGMGLWYWTQSLIGQRELTDKNIGDGLLEMTAGVNAYLNQHPAIANGLLIASSLIIDALTVFLFAWSLLGKTIRPFLGLLILFALRQVCQGLCALPAPEFMIWQDPGFPTLFVTYEVANDFFFSGHTAMAVYGAIELARLGRRWLVYVAVLVVVFQVSVVIVLRAHYTMDVFAGAVTALYVAGLAQQLAPSCDRAMTLRR